MTETRTPSTRRPSPPDLDAEQEVDFGRWARSLAQRWWLPVGGLILGLAVGYLLSLGGNQVYQAEALVSLGTPFTPNGGGIITQSLGTNPRTVTEIIHSESALKSAAAAAKIRVGQLRGRVSQRTISGGTGVRATGTPIVGIDVQGSRPVRTEVAANRLAAIVVSRLSPYVDVIIKNYEAQIASQQDQLDSLAPRIKTLNAALGAPGLALLDKLVLVSELDNAEARRGQLVTTLTTTQQQLALARQIESPLILQKAAAVKTTARSRRNSVLIGGLIGLILGILAALLWDPVAGRANRRPAV
jgi:uncharacterized protein involved in exopolysaccharide biosynthesis